MLLGTGEGYLMCGVKRFVGRGGGVWLPEEVPIAVVRMF